MTYEQFFIVVASLTMSGAIVYAARHWLQPRKNGESLSLFVQRASADRSAYIAARQGRHGTTTTSIAITLFSSVMLIGLMWLLTHAHTVRWIAVAYVVIGAYLAPRLIATPPGWGILSMIDRLLWRVDYSWFWPFLVARKFLKHINEKGVQE